MFQVIAASCFSTVLLLVEFLLGFWVCVVVVFSFFLFSFGKSLATLFSGLLALSIERNHNMKMWNLTKGRCSFTTKLPSEAEIVKFFPQSGESYALVLGTALEIRNAETGSTIHRLQHDKKVFCIAQREVILHFLNPFLSCSFILFYFRVIIN